MYNPTITDTTTDDDAAATVALTTSTTTTTAGDELRHSDVIVTSSFSDVTAVYI